MIASGSTLGLIGEIRVMGELFPRGINLTKPIPDKGIDLILENNKRVQVKTTATICNTTQGHSVDCYCFTLPRKNGRGGKGLKTFADFKKAVDFVICYAIPDKFWIIPIDQVGHRGALKFSANPKRQRKNYQFRDAWDLLK